MKIHKYSTAQEAAKSCGETLTYTVRDYLENDYAVLLMLSGGSALGVLDYVKAQHYNKNVTLSVLDERHYVDDDLNNFILISKTRFYMEALQQDVEKIASVPYEKETRHELGERFHKGLLDWREKYPIGKVVVTQGIGVDGHTAGIMPADSRPAFNEMFMQGEWVVDYDSEGVLEPPHRITVTPNFLMQQVDDSFVYAVGSEKKHILERLTHDKPEMWNYPAAVIHKMKKVRIYTDQKV